MSTPCRFVPRSDANSGRRRTVWIFGILPRCRSSWRPSPDSGLVTAVPTRAPGRSISRPVAPSPPFSCCWSAGAVALHRRGPPRRRPGARRGVLVVPALSPPRPRWLAAHVDEQARRRVAVPWPWPWSCCGVGPACRLDRPGTAVFTIPGQDHALGAPSAPVGHRVAYLFCLRSCRLQPSPSGWECGPTPCSPLSALPPLPGIVAGSSTRRRSRRLAQGAARALLRAWLDLLYSSDPDWARCAHGVLWSLYSPVLFVAIGFRRFDRKDVPSDRRVRRSLSHCAASITAIKLGARRPSDLHAEDPGPPPAPITGGAWLRYGVPVGVWSRSSLDPGGTLDRSRTLIPGPS